LGIFISSEIPLYIPTHNGKYQFWSSRSLICNKQRLYTNYTYWNRYSYF